MINCAKIPFCSFLSEYIWHAPLQLDGILAWYYVVVYSGDGLCNVDLYITSAICWHIALLYRLLCTVEYCCGLCRECWHFCCVSSGSGWLQLMIPVKVCCVFYVAYLCLTLVSRTFYGAHKATEMNWTEPGILSTVQFIMLVEIKVNLSMLFTSSAFC